ncbi:MAG: hypothetical protein ACLTWE_02825 [Dysgonomonas mossii]|uniref:hypothetical protein n=1 Tax=Dysgonomonas mossii TaxID=163665 RepID=UPI0039949C1E
MKNSTEKSFQVEEIILAEDRLNEELKDVKGGFSGQVETPGCSNGGGCSGGNGAAMLTAW